MRHDDRGHRFFEPLQDGDRLRGRLSVEACDRFINEEELRPAVECPAETDQSLLSPREGHTAFAEKGRVSAGERAKRPVEIYL